MELALLPRSQQQEHLMPRFYFHIRNHEDLVRDLEGVEMPNARAALDEAQEAAREILAEKVRKGEIVDGNEFEVHDELGGKLFTLPFKSVLRVE
jgi:hypothetical protein